MKAVEDSSQICLSILIILSYCLYVNGTSRQLRGIVGISDPVD